MQYAAADHAILPPFTIDLSITVEYSVETIYIPVFLFFNMTGCYAVGYENLRYSNTAILRATSGTKQNLSGRDDLLGS